MGDRDTLDATTRPTTNRGIEMVELTTYDYEAAECRCRAAQELQEITLVATLRPELSQDGDQWCFLYGKNLQSGVAGFGDTPAQAVSNFNDNWRSEKIKKVSTQIEE